MRIGIDIGGTTIAAGLLEGSDHILRKKQIATNAQEGPDVVIERIGDMVQGLIDEAALSPAGLKYIGIGCAGMINRQTGEVIYSNNLDWNNVPLGGKLRNRFGCDAYVENDAICATLGEFVAGAGKGVRSMVMITLGTGIGGGLILDNKLYHGANDAACILGHMVIKKDGILCNCGKNGCFEVYASTTALIREAELAAKRYPQSALARYQCESGKLNGIAFFRALGENDLAAKETFEAYTDDLAVGIGSIINIINPQMLVIGGGLSNEGERLLEPVRSKVVGQLYCGQAAMPEIRAATLSNDAGIVGAAALCDYQ